MTGTCDSRRLTRVMTIWMIRLEPVPSHHWPDFNYRYPKHTALYDHNVAKACCTSGFETNQQNDTWRSESAWIMIDNAAWFKWATLHLGSAAVPYSALHFPHFAVLELGTNIHPLGFYDTKDRILRCVWILMQHTVYFCHRTIENFCSEPSSLQAWLD